MERISRESRRQIPPERARTSPEKQAVKPKDSFISMLIFQIAICALGLAVILAGKFGGEERFNKAREFASAMCGIGQEEIIIKLPTSSLEIVSVQIKSIFSNLKKAVENAINKNITAIDELLSTEKKVPQGGSFPVAARLDEFGFMNPPNSATFAPYVLTAALRMPVTGAITSAFGYRQHPITQKTDFHTGIDIAAPEGATVYAVLPGEVSETGYSEIYGNYVKLNHSKKLSTKYCHCTKILAQEGAELSRGDRIALVGSTGISTGPHLHFEIIINEKNVDPMPALFPQM